MVIIKLKKEVRKMSINGNGYDGYSMSNNARMAYEDCHKMPLSKWTKTELLSAIKSYNVSADIILALQKHNTDTLRRELLMYSGWHHTSEYYNKTNFYAIDADKVNELTVNCIDNWDKAENTVSSLKYRGDFNYVEWQGSRNYPKAVPHCLENVNIEERGSFYYVTDADDKLLIKKKIGSNGTRASSYTPEKTMALKIMENQSAYQMVEYREKIFISAYDTFDSKDEFLEALKECKLPDGSFDNRYDFTIYNNYHEIISGEYNQVLEDIQDIGLWHNDKWDFYLTRNELETMGVPKDFIDHTLAVEKDLDMEKE
jgi:hypothetical protein